MATLAARKEEVMGRALDDLDLRIMAELQEDGRRPFREISQRLGVAPGTVRMRVLQLIEERVFSVIAVPDPWRMGYGFHATVGLKLQPGQSEAVADLLAEREEIGWVGLTSSIYDVMFEVALPDSRAFGQYREHFLAALPGCLAVDVFEIWGVRKVHYRLLPPADWASAEQPATQGHG
jgi:Lrp/AsnC family transcriptional regulator for asnA, asnC and gidA